MLRNQAPTIMSALFQNDPVSTFVLFVQSLGLGALGTILTFSFFLILFGLYRRGALDKLIEGVPALNSILKTRTKGAEQRRTARLEADIEKEKSERRLRDAAFEAKLATDSTALLQAGVYVEQLGALLDSDHEFIREQVAADLEAIKSLLIELNIRIQAVERAIGIEIRPGEHEGQVSQVKDMLKTRVLKKGEK